MGKRRRLRRGGRVLARGGSRAYMDEDGVALCIERWSLAREYR